MRRVRRRRPAGQPQVPVVALEPVADPRVVGPALVRIGPDRTLLDPPLGMVECTVAHVWPDDRLAGGWARVPWPLDAWSHRPIAPLDLHLGHVLQLAKEQDGRRLVRYSVVADVDEQRFVLVSAASAVDAISVARRAVDVWRLAELAAIADEWRERIVTVHSSPNTA